MEYRIRRVTLGITVLMTIVVFGTLFVLLVTVTRNSIRFAPVAQNLEFVWALKEIDNNLEAAVDSAPAERVASPIDAMVSLVAQLKALDDLAAPLSISTQQRLRDIDQRIDGRVGPAMSVRELRGTLRDIVKTELEGRLTYLGAISSDLEREAWLIKLVVIAFFMLSLLGFITYRQYVVLPTREVAELLAKIGTPTSDVIDTASASRALRPLLTNYNDLVTRLKKLEAERQLREQSLEQQVHITTGSLMQLQLTLASSEKLAVVGEIAAGIAHELRNPLAGIRTALDNLYNDSREPEQQARLSLVINELKRMTSLLNHLLERSDIVSEPPVSVFIADAIDEVVQIAKLQLAETVTIRQRIDPLPGCSLPENRFRQAILNLVLNAGQVNDGPVQIDITADRAADRIEVAVTDDGIGFSEYTLRSGPVPFASTRIQGTGLGLAIVRRFAQDLGGQLILSNVEPHGARAVLVLPCTGANHG